MECVGETSVVKHNLPFHFIEKLIIHHFDFLFPRLFTRLQLHFAIRSTLLLIGCNSHFIPINLAIFPSEIDETRKIRTFKGRDRVVQQEKTSLIKQPIERRRKKESKRKIEQISKFRQNQFVMHNRMVVG